MSCDCASKIGSERVINPAVGYKSVDYVFDGMKVFMPSRDARPRQPDALPNGGILVTVIVAAGSHARVVNKTRGIDQWVHISTLVSREA